MMCTLKSPARGFGEKGAASLLPVGGKTAFLLGAFLLLFGCAQAVKVYPRGDGLMAKGIIETDIDYRGRAEMTLPDGERFEGEYVPVARGSAFGWGLMEFYGLTGSRAYGPGSVYEKHTIGNAQAILAGERGGQMRCEISYNAANHGYGVCEASDGRVFDIVF